MITRSHAVVAIALLAASSMSIVDAQPARKCTAAEYRQFDFWLGNWDVRDANGKLVGRNRIVQLYDGCALMESWSGATGNNGTSLNIYDSDRKHWHQTWVDSNGGLLQLDGGLVDGAMVLRGESIDAQAPSKAMLQRVTWTPLPDGRVRQRWESSNDGGVTWSVVFDGFYSKRK